MDDLPLELKRRIASFLSPLDTVALSSTCRSLRQTLYLRDLPSIGLRSAAFTPGNNDEDGELIQKGFRIPVLFPQHLHSISLSFRWRDQGWGNRKGRIWIVAERSVLPEEDEDPGDESTIEDEEEGLNDATTSVATVFDLPGRVVYASDVAEHALSRVDVVWGPSDHNESYHVYYKVGGGGGHLLFLEQIQVHPFIWDDEGCLSRNYRILHELRALGRPGFLMELLQQVAGTMRQQAIPSLLEFLRSYGFETSEPSLVALEEIVRADRREQQLATLHDRSNEGEAPRPPRPHRVHLAVPVHVPPQGGRVAIRIRRHIVPMNRRPEQQPMQGDEDTDG